MKNKKNNIFLFIVLGIVILLGIIAFLIFKNGYFSQEPIGQNNQPNTAIATSSAINEIVNWNTYSSSIYKITFKYPKDWKANDSVIVGTSREEISINPFLGDNMDINGVVNFYILKKQHPYGDNPLVENYKIENQNASLIISDESSNNIFSTLVVHYPKSVFISRPNYKNEQYNYLEISFIGIDLNLVRKIIGTIKFINFN